LALEVVLLPLEPIQRLILDNYRRILHKAEAEVARAVQEKQAVLEAVDSALIYLEVLHNLDKDLLVEQVRLRFQPTQAAVAEVLAQ
jgi:hypothetical protein